MLSIQKLSDDVAFFAAVWTQDGPFSKYKVWPY